MSKILLGGDLFTPHDYTSEAEFERDIVSHARSIFGKESLYIDVKKKIGTDIVTIPDGYLIDFSFASQPRLYVIENELATHDPYRHIGQQLLRFAISYRQSGRRIKKFLLEEIMRYSETREFVAERVKRAGARNIDAFLEDLVFEHPVAALVVIDQASDDLENVLGQLTMKTDIIDFRAYTCGDRVMYLFTPFQQDVKSAAGEGATKLDVEELDTIVVPAREEGFRDTFIGEDCWYQIRISSSMLERIKYIAAYRVAPISAITHVAEVANIEKYQDTNKYILWFKESAREIGPVRFDNGEQGLVPQAPRYTSYEKLSEATTLADVF
jgi:hypothetical protein